jgi:hypothetical protein
MTVEPITLTGERKAQPSRFAVGRFLGAACVALVVAAVVPSAEAVLTTLSYSPNPVDLNDLDHHMLYTWRLDNLPTESVTAASITLTNIGNWDANANKLFGHLLDSALNAGVASFIDDPSLNAPVTDITDDFVNTRNHSNANWLLAPGTADTKLFGKSFTMTPDTWTYTFSTTELAKLNQYMADGTIAFGFDPDCHYFNDGITFNMTFTAPPAPGASPIPEASAILPLGGVMLMAIGVQARSRRRAATLFA